MSSIFIQVLSDTAPCTCQDCDWQGPASALDMVSEIEERIAAGEIVPAGQCPECGALASLDEPEARPGPADVVIPRVLLQRLVNAADTTAEEWKTGIKDGTYEADLQGDLDKVQQSIKAAEELLAGAPVPAPVYVIGIEGGIVQGISTNVQGADPSILVVDWDADGNGSAVKIGGSDATVCSPSVAYDPKFVAEVIAADDAADQKEEG